MKRRWQICLFVAPIIFILALIVIGAGSGKSGGSHASPYAGQFLSQTKNLQPEIVPGVVAVKIKSSAAAQTLAMANTITGLSSLDAKLQRFGATSVQKMFRHKPIPPNSNIPDISRILKVRIPERLSPVMVARELEGDPNVEYAEPVYVRRLLAVPNDPMYAQQQHLPQIHAPEAWNIQKGDSTVLIAIVDTGVDYHHEDLAANVWTNESEANGAVGVDDDGNGFVDDIHGWDFGDGDADPTPPPPGTNAAGHGTHVAGIACAVTNNGIGVAGVSWNCEYMPIKAADDNNTLWIWNGFEGIVYAADNGADVISNSWGGYEFLQWEQDVINYAYSKGAVVVCGAGNDNGEIAFYPAAYQHVVSVAAVSVNDLKTGYSSFGPWIDISAPGGSQGAWILSTVPGNRYAGGWGTSMATPVVSGVCGLVKSLHPNWTNDQIVRQVLLSVDNIEALNPQYRNRLGHGRVNAYRALTDSNLPEPDARLALFSSSLSDSLQGNDNGLFDRGETIQLRCNVQNCSIGGAGASTLRLSSSSAGVEILNGTVNPAFFPADTSLPFDFTLRIGDGAPAEVELVLKLETSLGYAREETIGFTIGNRALLLIDNDFGYPNASVPDVESYFRNILDQNNMFYGYWDAQRIGFPAAQTLQQFPIVVLSCSNSGYLSSEQERNAIRSYLDSGGKLFVSGQDIAAYLFVFDGSDEAKAFVRDYLHAEYLSDDSEDQEVKGVKSDPISDGMAFHIWQPGLIAAWQYPDVIAPTAGASTIFTYSDGRAGAVKYAGDHRVVYLGFGLEAVDSYESTPFGAPSSVRTELFMRIIHWLNFIEHEPLQFTEDTHSARAVAANVTGNVADLQTMTLLWRLQGEQNFTAVPMTETAARHYAAEIPGPGSAATIEYYLQTSHPYYDWQSPVGAPDTVYSYYVGPDTLPPSIAEFSKVRSHLSNWEPCPVSAVVEDNLGVEANGVYAHVRATNRAIADSVLLTPSGEPGRFAGELPLKFSVGDTVEYKVAARDVSVAGNIGASAWQRFVIGYEDFESGIESWLADSAGWRLFLNGHSGKHSVNSSLKGYYPPNQDVSLTSKYGLDLSHTEKAVLTFWTAHFIEADNDAGFIEVSADGAATWQRLNYACTGTYNQWRADSVSLSNFCGAGFDDVRIRFRFISDATQSQQKTGWYIDDVRVLPNMETAVAENESAVPGHFALHQNYPNPFNPSTTIEFALPKTSFVTLKIYDLLGNEVATLVAEKLPAGRHQRVWEAKGLASGVYLYRIAAGEFVQTRKLILLQ